MKPLKIIEICGEHIDLAKVIRVGSVGGDPSWSRYTVYFEGGSSMEIYQKRRFADNLKLIQMEREKFIELWMSCKS